MNAILVSSLLFVCAADDKPPAPKLPIGKDTTYVNGPLDKNGFIDYEAALNAELSKNITHDKNAKALLILALGPAPEGGDGLPPAYFKWLDITAPPKEGKYLQNIYKVAHDRLGLTRDQLDKLYEFQSRATQRPWSEKDAAPLVEWIKANEKPLEIVHEAVKRPMYYNPLCSRRKEGESSNLISVLLPSVQKCREIGSLLACRAMLRVNEGKFDDAWKDIIACHRLGRLMTNGATLIESLVGIAICQIASNATVAYIAHADLTSKQCLERMKELRDLPARPLMADKINLAERFMGLDALQLIRRGEGFEGGNKKPSEEDLKALEAIDWTPAMKSLNAYYDRAATALRIKDRAAREKELDAIDRDLEALVKKNRELGDLDNLVKNVKSEKDAGKKIGDLLVALLTPAVRKVQGAFDRIEQVERNIHLAFAMAAYHKDTGRYPAKLADLAPKYIATVPDDIFNGKPLTYRASAKGYLFYSVGQNGKDEDGRWYNDDPPGDDPNVRMPLPELKK